MKDISILIPIIGALVALTNIVVEVIKKVTWDKLPTNIVATIVAEVLTLVTFFAYTNYKNINIVWYSVVSAIVVELGSRGIIVRNAVCRSRELSELGGAVIDAAARGNRVIVVGTVNHKGEGERLERASGI